jgi:FkbM family methyltransferase
MAPTISLLRERLVRDFEELLDGIEPERPRAIDAVFFDRIVLGEGFPDDLAAHDARVAGRSLLSFLYENLSDTAAQHRYPHLPSVNRELMWERPDGLRIFFNLRDLGVGAQIMQGTFDPEIEQLLAASVTPGAVCLDIGANLGFYSVVMARAGGRVHAFEAFAYNHALLERNVAENGVAERVKAHLVGCGARAGVGRVCGDPRTINLGSMYVLVDPNVELPDGHESAEIPLARVDDLVPETERVDLVKIDVEGAELDVLQGMPRILHRDRPRVVFEINSKSLRENRGVEAQAVVDLFHSHGYVLVEAKSLAVGTAVVVDEIPADLEIFDNLVALPNERA